MKRVALLPVDFAGRAPKEAFQGSKLEGPRLWFWRRTSGPTWKIRLETVTVGQSMDKDSIRLKGLSICVYIVMFMCVCIVYIYIAGPFMPISVDSLEAPSGERT